MEKTTDAATAIRMLRGLEDGGMQSAEARTLAQDLDPVLVFAIVQFLREVYPASDPAASPVLERVLALTSIWPGLVAKSKEGEQDPVGGWFLSEHSFSEFKGRGNEMIEMIVDKLET